MTSLSIKEDQHAHNLVSIQSNQSPSFIEFDHDDTQEVQRPPMKRPSTSDLSDCGSESSNKSSNSRGPLRKRKGHNPDSSVPTTVTEQPSEDADGYTDYSRVSTEEMNGTSAFYFAAASAREPPFPVKLHQILSNPDFADIIAWLPHGRSWRVLKPKAFEDRVIPLHFRHCRYSSFMRQVNGWGFKRVFQGADLNSYYHELFLRGLPQLCLKMRRPGKQQTQSKAQAANAPTPDFYKISEENPLPEPPAAGYPKAEQQQVNRTESSSTRPGDNSLAGIARQAGLLNSLPNNSLSGGLGVREQQLALLMAQADQGNQSQGNNLGIQQMGQQSQTSQLDLNALTQAATATSTSSAPASQQGQLSGISPSANGNSNAMNELAQLRSALMESQLQNQLLASSLRNATGPATNTAAEPSPAASQLGALGGSSNLGALGGLQGGFQNSTTAGLQGGLPGLGQQAIQQQLLQQLLQQQGNNSGLF